MYNLSLLGVDESREGAFRVKMLRLGGLVLLLSQPFFYSPTYTSLITFASFGAEQGQAGLAIADLEILSRTRVSLLPTSSSKALCDTQHDTALLESTSRLHLHPTLSTPLQHVRLVAVWNGLRRRSRWMREQRCGVSRGSNALLYISADPVVIPYSYPLDTSV